MDNLIPIEKVLETNPRVQELEKEGYIITPKNINAYLESFKKKKSKLIDVLILENKMIS